ncbi:MAG TPA: hypothetical protein VK604_06600 [Bryobacteraceae bacterium]|nr:hypothetical protein [Bryobacteraceae bacterium]
MVRFNPPSNPVLNGMARVMILLTTREILERGLVASDGHTAGHDFHHDFQLRDLSLRELASASLAPGFVR